MDLMTIGAFAERTRLSAKALRLYDRLGLVPPARTDPASGYRFYSEDQGGRRAARTRTIPGRTLLGITKHVHAHEAGPRWRRPPTRLRHGSRNAGGRRPARCARS
jgi:DNA-binding transcriptional MerR regulator